MSDNTTVKRISLWSGPRNISTALMYSFAQRRDTRVFDEPLYAHFLSHNIEAQAYHPGADEVLRTMENDGKKVVEMMISATDKPVLFYKNMTHHLPGLDTRFLSNLINVILTRDPVEMLPSYADVIETPTLDDVGYRMQVQLMEELERKNLPVVIVDSADVVKDPAGHLKKLCNAAEIPFDEAMLRWQAGPRPEDGCWASYWYRNVHQSTGFQPYSPKTTPFPEHLKTLLDECRPYYERLVEKKL
jgi:hypothetical protein